MNRALHLLSVLLLVLAPFTLAACDDEDERRPEEVDGRYRFEVFTFTSGTVDDPGPIEVDLLNYLDEAETELVVRTRPTFDLFFLLEGEQDDDVVSGTYSVDGSTVRFTADEGNEALLQSILLPTAFNLAFEDANPDVLRGTFSQTVDLNEFDPTRFSGLTQIRGVTRVVLVED